MTDRVILAHHYSYKRKPTGPLQPPTTLQKMNEYIKRLSILDVDELDVVTGTPVAEQQQKKKDLLQVQAMFKDDHLDHMEVPTFRNLEYLIMNHVKST
jgi:hypothetical protein